MELKEVGIRPGFRRLRPLEEDGMFALLHKDAATAASSRLTSITRPAPMVSKGPLASPITAFGSDPAKGRLTSVTNAENKTTTSPTDSPATWTQSPTPTTPPPLSTALR